MGLHIGFSRSSLNDSGSGKIIGFSKSSIAKSIAEKVVDKFPLPDAGKFEIIRSHKLKNHVILLVHYDGCTNYEGKKILVYEGISLVELLKRNEGKLDPHFDDDKRYVHPVARFNPTDKYFEMAIKMFGEIERKLVFR